MFQKLATCGTLLFAASGALATPLLSGSDLVARGFGCPPDIPCGPGPACTPATCDLDGCKDAEVCQGYQNDERSLAATLPERSFGPCPVGEQCGHGPVCTIDLCDYPGCEDAPVCQGNQDRKRSGVTSVANRSFGPCPPGAFCGHGPVCTTGTCDLPGCEDAPACQDGPDNKKRSATGAALVARQFGCPPGLQCGHGPVCAGELCSDPVCAGSSLCQDYNNDQNRKRSPATDIAHPICDICTIADNGEKVCGCATTTDGEIKQRDAERVCPLYCIETDDGETLCGCAAQDYENSLHGGPKLA